MPSTAKATRRGAGVPFNLAAASAFHVALAGAVGAAGSMEGCSRGDAVAGGTGIALVIEIVVTGLIVLWVFSRHRDAWRPVLTGWALSYPLVIVLAIVAFTYAHSAGSGCAL